MSYQIHLTKSQSKELKQLLKKTTDAKILKRHQSIHFKNQDQKDLFRPLLKEFINPQQALIQLSEKIDWQGLESALGGLRSIPTQEHRQSCHPPKADFQ